MNLHKLSESNIWLKSLSHRFRDKGVFLQFTQKFKMAAKNDKKKILKNTHAFEHSLLSKIRQKAEFSREILLAGCIK